MPDIKILNPDVLGKPLGQYSQITRVKASEFLFIAGQVGADNNGKAADDFDAQCVQTFANIVRPEVLGQAFERDGVHRLWCPPVFAKLALSQAQFRRCFRAAPIRRHVLIVDRLVQEPFLIEVQTVAAL
jgi:hypothetical protein